MLYFVDGSNVLGAQDMLDKPGAERALLAAIDRYCRKHRDKARVIFDGFNGGMPGDVIKFSENIHAEIPQNDGRNNRADRLIMRRIESLGDRRNARLVTDDRELADAAFHIGISIESCREFLARLFPRKSDQSEPAGDEKAMAARDIDNNEFIRLWVEKSSPEPETVER